jgi:hypothetical protein
MNARSASNYLNAFIPSVAVSGIRTYALNASSNTWMTQIRSWLHGPSGSETFYRGGLINNRMSKPEKTFKQVLRETPWSAILVPFALALLVVLATIAIVVFGD